MSSLFKKVPFPFHKLPPELLIAVFAHGEHSQSSGTPFPIVVSRVCRAWRTVVLDAAPLWSNIRLCYTRTPPNYHLASTYLARSKSSLLNVQIELHGTAHNRGLRTAITTIADLLIPNIGRIRRLTVFAENEPVLHLALLMFRLVAAPALEDLRISILDNLDQPEMPLADAHATVSTLPQLFAAGALNLRSLRMNGTTWFAQPMQKLTTFSLVMSGNRVGGTLGLRPLAEFLMGVSDTLTHLTLLELSFVPGTEPIAPFELPALEWLHIDDFTLLHLLETPQLKTLYIQPYHDVPSLSQLSDICVFSKLQSLVSLTLDGLNLADLGNQPELFDRLPNLEELHMWYCFNESALLHSLIPEVTQRKRRIQEEQTTVRTSGIQIRTKHGLPEVEPDDSVPVPRLRSLTVTPAESWKVTRRVLAARLARGHTIEYLRCLPLGGRFDHGHVEEWARERGIKYEELNLQEASHERGHPQDLRWRVHEDEFDEDGVRARDVWFGDVPEEETKSGSLRAILAAIILILNVALQPLLLFHR